MGSKTIKKLADNIDPSMFEFAEYDESKSELTGYSNYSFWRSTLQVFMKNKTAVAFLIIVAVIVVFTLLQPYLPNQKSPTQNNIRSCYRIAISQCSAGKRSLCLALIP